MEQKVVLTLLWVVCWIVFFGGSRRTLVPVRTSGAFRLSTYVTAATLFAWSVVAWREALVSDGTPFAVGWTGVAVACAGQIIICAARRGLPLSNYDTLFSIATSYTRRGPYAYLNHPMYIGLVLALIGSSLALGSVEQLILPLLGVALSLAVRASLE